VKLFKVKKYANKEIFLFDAFTSFCLNTYKNTGMENMKTGIVGAGALGSLFSYKLLKAGHEPVVLEKDPLTAASLRKRLIYEGSDGSRDEIQLPHVHTEPSALGECRYILLLVKSYATETAMKSIAPFLSEKNIIATLQNGLGNREIISQYTEDRKILIGTTTTGATKVSPDTVRFGGSGKIVLGGTDGHAADELIEIFKKAGFDTEKSSNPDRAVWEKAIINAAINPLGALLGVPNGRLVEKEETLACMKEIITEAVTVARKTGLEIDTDSMISRTVEVCHSTAGNLCSMLQDVSGGRKTEIDAINGRIASLADTLKINAPVNRTITRLIKGLEG